MAWFGLVLALVATLAFSYSQIPKQPRWLKLGSRGALAIVFFQPLALWVFDSLCLASNLQSQAHWSFAALSMAAVLLIAIAVGIAVLDNMAARMLFGLAGGYWVFVWAAFALINFPVS